jgi:hypothetical protein
MLDDPTGLRRMADQCRTMAASRHTEELRNVFLNMARRYDDQAIQQERCCVEQAVVMSTPMQLP